jgi:hypothetical protein
MYIYIYIYIVSLTTPQDDPRLTPPLPPALPPAALSAGLGLWMRARLGRRERERRMRAFGERRVCAHERTRTRTHTHTHTHTHTDTHAHPHAFAHARTRARALTRTHMRPPRRAAPPDADYGAEAAAGPGRPAEAEEGSHVTGQAWKCTDRLPVTEVRERERERERDKDRDRDSVTESQRCV